MSGRCSSIPNASRCGGSFQSNGYADVSAASRRQDGSCPLKSHRPSTTWAASTPLFDVDRYVIHVDDGVPMRYLVYDVIGPPHIAPRFIKYYHCRCPQFRIARHLICRQYPATYNSRTERRHHDHLHPWRRLRRTVFVGTGILAESRGFACRHLEARIAVLDGVCVNAPADPIRTNTGMSKDQIPDRHNMHRSLRRACLVVRVDVTTSHITLASAGADRQRPAHRPESRHEFHLVKHPQDDSIAAVRRVRDTGCTCVA